MRNDRRQDPADRLADLLIDVAGDQNVRALEAVAAALANRRDEIPDDAPDAGPLAGSGLHEAASRFKDQRYQLCRRIARRALGGTLGDLVAGATLFHRIDADPPWARRLLPVAVFGSFLFYRAPPAGEPLRSSTIGVDHEPVPQERPSVERVLDDRGGSAHHGRE